MALKQTVGEEELVNITGNSANWNLHSEQNNAIPHFLQQCEKTVDAVQLSLNKRKINDNNFHTANGDEIHSL